MASRRSKRKRRGDKNRYMSNVSIFSTMSFVADENCKSVRIPSVKANQLPQHLFDVYEEAFDLLDSQQKGVIGAAEVGTVMRSMGRDPTEEEILATIEIVDKSGTKKLNFNDFLTLLAYISQEEESESEWKTVFDQFDQDGDGYIDAKDLRATLTQLRVKFTETDVQEMISEFTGTTKGVSWNDFMNIVGRQQD